MTTRVKENDPSFGASLRNFRTTAKLTQAQLAVAAGIAPTSVYRYEAGLSNPDLLTLQKLSIFADKQGDPTAREIFLKAMRLKSGLEGDEPNYGLDIGRKSLSDFTVRGEQLSAREQLLARAFVLMLRNNVEESTERMIRALLDPWMTEAKADFDQIKGREAPLEFNETNSSEKKKS